MDVHRLVSDLKKGAQTISARGQLHPSFPAQAPSGPRDDALFQLQKLSEGPLANVLRCLEPGSIGGFHLPLALLQVRILGTLDPHWTTPMLAVASRSRAILDHLSSGLVALTLSQPGLQQHLAVDLLPHLTRLERLEASEPAFGVVRDEGCLDGELLLSLPPSITCIYLDSCYSASAPGFWSGFEHLSSLEELTDGLGPPGPEDGPFMLASLRHLSIPLLLPGLPGIAPGLRSLCIGLWTDRDIGDLAPLGGTLTALTLLVPDPSSVSGSNASVPTKVLKAVTEAAPILCRLSLAMPAWQQDAAFSSMSSMAVRGLLSGLTALTRLEIQLPLNTESAIHALQAVARLRDRPLDLCLGKVQGAPRLMSMLPASALHLRAIGVHVPPAVVHMGTLGALTRLTRLELHCPEPLAISPAALPPSLEELWLTGKRPAGCEETGPS